MQKVFRSKLILYIITLLSIICLLSSCVKTPQSLLSKTGEPGYMLPRLHGIENAASHNEQLKTYFSQVNNALNFAGTAAEGAELDFAIIPKEGEYVLNSWIMGKEGQKLLLEDITLHSGGITLPEIKYLDILSDAAFLSRSLFLASKGYELRLYDLDSPITTEKIYALLSIYYENYTESEIDYAHVNRADITDVFQLKSLAIMPEILEGYYPHEPVYIQDFLRCISLLITEILFDSFGLGSSGFTALDLDSSFSLYHALAVLSLEGNENMDKWQNFGRDFSELLKSGIGTQEQQKDLIRDDLASFFAFIYQEHFHLEDYEYYYAEFTDEQSENGSFCVGQGLMDGFPQYGMFHYDYVSRFYELPSITNTFVAVCLNDNFNIWETSDLSLLDEGSAIKSLDLLDAYFNSIPHTKIDSGTKVTKINDRDYDWHMRQYGTGEYADVNCMPTMTAMAVKWVNQDTPVTVEELRERFLPNFPDGWWMAQVVASLENFGIAYNYGEISKKGVVDAIDKGEIVLAMFSEAEPNEQGHCEIIYGYEKFGDSLRFIVQDPGFDNELRPDGMPRGRARWLDAEYLIWTVERMNNMVVSLKAVE